MPISTAPLQRELLEGSILITGTPRSGTTLLGKLIGSLERIEYQFEPPTLYMVAAAYAAGELPLATAKELLTVYFCEDLLLEAVHGRSVNLRPHDASQVLHRLTWGELHERWQQVGNRADAIHYCQQKKLRLGIKLPNLFDSLTLMRQTLPGLKVLISVRNGDDVIRSIVAKGWVDDARLARDLWPYVNHTCTINIPYWVPEAYRDRWEVMDPLSRATLMWTVHAEWGLTERQQDDVIEVRYENLVAAPWPILEDLAAQLGHPPTLFSRCWIETIHPPRNNSSLKPVAQALKDRQPDLATWFTSINQAWGY